ncbi:MAG TPA: SDR family oxidoreductase [Polyangia bacterium]|nr:SDR family oxidoreductase [Polyangia bacterium]
MRMVLVTGATGFLGGALAMRLLDEYPDLRLMALARGRGELSPTARVHASLRRFSDLSSATAARLTVVAGDLERLDALSGPPLDEVSHVVHFAVDGSAHGPRVNLEGTRALARLALRSRRLERFVYVGSAWSCGAQRTGLVSEDDSPGSEPVLPYLADKVIVEQALERLLGLPLVVIRPSLAIGHTRLGCEPSASLFWALRLIDRIACLPWRREQRLDAVPVDWLSCAIEHLLFAPALSHRRYHLSAGLGGVSWEEIEAAFALVTGAVRSYERVPAAVWAARAAPALCGDPEARETLARCLRFLEGDAVFDNTRALAAGLAPPPRLTSYLGVCLHRARGRTLLEQAGDDA